MSALQELAPNDLVAHILFEEWLFATQHSVIIARLKRVVRLLADSGARVLEVVNRVGTDSFEEIVERAPTLNRDMLLQLLALKVAAGKIIAGSHLARGILPAFLARGGIDLPPTVDDLLVLIDP